MGLAFPTGGPALVNRKTWAWISKDGISSFDSSKSLEQVTPLSPHSLYHEAGVTIPVKHAWLSSKCQDISQSQIKRMPLPMKRLPIPRSLVVLVPYLCCVEAQRIWGEWQIGQVELKAPAPIYLLLWLWRTSFRLEWLAKVRKPCLHSQRNEWQLTRPRPFQGEGRHAGRCLPSPLSANHVLLIGLNKHSKHLPLWNSGKALWGDLSTKRGNVPAFTNLPSGWDNKIVMGKTVSSLPAH